MLYANCTFVVSLLNAVQFVEVIALAWINHPKQIPISLLPQVAETNTPRVMDATGTCLLYYEIRRNI